MTQWLPRLVARLPASVHAKLLVAFLVIAGLLVTVSAVGLGVLGETNRRAEELVILHRKIAAYRQLQHDTTGQLYSVTSTLALPLEQVDARMIEAALRQLKQFGYDLDRLQYVAKDEATLLSRIQEEYNRFIQVMSEAITMIAGGRVTAARELQRTQATPLADRLERLTNELVNKAEAEMVEKVERSHNAYTDLPMGGHWGCGGQRGPGPDPRLCTRRGRSPGRSRAWTPSSNRSPRAISPSVWQCRTGTSSGPWQPT